MPKQHSIRKSRNGGQVLFDPKSRRLHIVMIYIYVHIPDYCSLKFISKLI